MLRTRRRWSSTSVVALALGVFVVPLMVTTPARAEPSDGVITVMVDIDTDRDGVYDPGLDTPVAGIEITVTDAAGSAVDGITDSGGHFEVTPTAKLVGGRYFVTAELPDSMGQLIPAPESADFASFSTSVDVTSENQTVRMAVTTTTTSSESPEPPEPLAAPPEASMTATATATAPATATATAPAPDPDPGLSVAPRSGLIPNPPPARKIAEPRFAVGDRVFRDPDGAGLQPPDSTTPARISVQLLNGAGDVVASTKSLTTGRYSFDNLPAGAYAVRFAGLPDGYRFSPAGVGDDRTMDSDPDYTGVTPVFTLGVNERNVRRVTSQDGVDADYINPSVDAGMTVVRYAVSNRVWLDVNGDGIAQPTEPGASATVSLLARDRVIDTVATDPDGNFSFTGLSAGTYRLQFDGIGDDRSFTRRGRSADPSVNSDVDPGTGLTPSFTLSQGAPGLAPALPGNKSGVDFINQNVSAGLIGSYSIGDTVWRDLNGDGLLDPGDSGLEGVQVQLLTVDREVLAKTTTSRSGRYTFAKLSAGIYQVRFSGLPNGLRFTTETVGDNSAVDSDAGPDGVTSIVTVGEENPADTSIDAGVTTPANYSAPEPGSADGTTPPDTALSSTGGVNAGWPVGGLLLFVAGVGCLFVDRRRHGLSGPIPELHGHRSAPLS